MLDGQAWKAELDCTLVRPDSTSKTPYAVVVAFSPGERTRGGHVLSSSLDQAALHRLESDR